MGGSHSKHTHKLPVHLTTNSAHPANAMDMAHFLSCNHSTRTRLLQPLQPQIQKLHQKHDVHPQLYQLLWQGLMSTLLAHELTQLEEQYQGIYLQIHKWQECIGWVQLLYGLFDNLWIQAIEEQTVNGVNFYAKVTQLCWQYVITVWTEWNQALHNTTDLYDTSHLRATIQQIFHDAAKHPDTQSTIHNQSVESIMNQPLSQINSWVKYGAMHLRDHAKAVATREKLHTQDIWSFFSWAFAKNTTSSADKNLLWPP